MLLTISSLAETARPTPFPRERTLPAATALRVGLDESLDPRRNRAGDQFTGVLVSPVVENGAAVIPGGAHVYGRVVESRPSGRFKGRAELAFRLEAIEIGGRRYSVQTAVVSRETTDHKKRNFAWVGGGSGFGAAVGAIAAGGAGAPIEAGAGAAAGTVGAAVTGRKQLHIPAETALTFRLRAPVMVRA